MADEIVSIFTEVPEGVLIDATFGLGGHTLRIIEEIPRKFKVVGFDRDSEMLDLAKSKVGSDFRLLTMSYTRIPSFIKEEDFGPVTAVLFDTGLNSAQLDEPERGFSYRMNSNLDLRFDRSSGRPFYDMIDDLDLKELTGILKEYGQERNSRAIARKIIDKRPRTTDELAEIIRGVVGPRRFVKAASRVFQSLRIFVNN